MKKQVRADLAYLQAQTFKYRGGIWTAMFLAILFLAKPTPSRILPGLVLVVLGQAFRFWGTGCIALYRGEKVKATRLTVWGPYALVRNPLYVANGFLGLGWAIMAGLWPTFLFAVAFYVVYGLLIVPHEERFLLERFGQDYLGYRARVGAFFPRWPWRVTVADLAGPWDPAILIKSEVHSLLMTVSGTGLILSRLYW